MNNLLKIELKKHCEKNCMIEIYNGGDDWERCDNEICAFHEYNGDSCCFLYDIKSKYPKDWESK